MLFLIIKINIQPFSIFSCSSPVGYTGTANRITLGRGCWWRSTIMHEIGHSLGEFTQNIQLPLENLKTKLQSLKQVMRFLEFL